MSSVAQGSSMAAGEFSSVKDRYGHDKTDPELQSLFTDSSGDWLPWRHPENDRGDESTELKRQQSVEQVGIIPGIRKGAWLVRQNVSSKCFFVLHWASLIGGLRRAYEADKKKENKVVQHSVSAGVTSCKLYHHNLPSDCARYLKDLGNKFNDAATTTTFLEVARSCRDTEAGWNRRKKVFGWTNQSLGNSKYDEKKFEYIQSVFEGRWPFYRNYEVCCSLFRAASDLKCEAELEGDTTTEGQPFWEVFASRCQVEVDFTHMGARKHALIFQSLYTIFNAFHSKGGLLRKHSHHCMDIMMMTLPRLGGCLGTCSLAPSGLGVVPLTKITEEALEMLAVDMQDSSAEHLRLKFRKLQEDEQKRKADEDAKEMAIVVASGSREAPGSAKKRSKKAKSKQQLPMEELGNVGDFLDHLADLEKYLLTIDPNQSAKYKKFIHLAIYAQLAGQVQVLIGGAGRVIKRWSIVRRLMKADAYKTALLRPRRSDTDFLNDSDDMMGLLAAGEATASQKTVTNERAKEIMAEYMQLAEEMCSFFRRNNQTMPVMAHPDAATSLNQTMLSVMQALQPAIGFSGASTSASGSEPQAPNAPMTLITTAACHTLDVMPTKWNNLCVALRSLLTEGKQDLLYENEAFSELVKLGVTEELLVMLRTRLVLHICMSLGHQQFLRQDGSNLKPFPFLSAFMVDIASKGCAAFTEHIQAMVNNASATPPSTLEFFPTFERSGECFEKFLQSWMCEALAAESHIKEHCGKSFEQKKEQLSQSLSVMSLQEMKTYLENKKVFKKPLAEVGVKWNAKAEIFPSERAKVVQSIIAAFEKENQQSLKSVAIMSDP